MHQYRDVIVGSFYGHMNIDHFMLQDSKNVDIDAKADGKVSVNSKTDYLESLRNQWSSLPSPPPGIFEELASGLESEEPSEVAPAKKRKKGKKGKKEKKKREFLDKIGGPWAERYSVSLVSPSLVPNYFPSLRVIDYNITGLDDVANGAGSSYEVDDTISELDYTQDDTLQSSDTSPETQKKKNKKKKPNFKVPEPPSPTAPPGPAYSNQPFTLLSYTQYYANITKIHEEIAASQDDDPRINFEIEYNTNDEAYQMKDLTVRSFFQLAGRIAEEDEASETEVNSPSADSKKKKPMNMNSVWRAFLRRAYVGFENIDELDD